MEEASTAADLDTTAMPKQPRQSQAVVCGLKIVGEGGGCLVFLKNDTNFFFNHTALYTGIVSSRHSHLHVNNGPGSMAHQAHVPGECSQGSAAPVVLAQHRCGAHLRLTRRIMLWLFLCFVFCLSFFFLVRVISIFAF